MKTLLVILSGLLVVNTTLRAEPEIKGTATELAQHLANVPHMVALAGESEVKVAADRAVISLKVVTENKSLQEASRMNQEMRAKMLKALTDRGVPADRVQPSKFSSTPKYGVFGEKAKSYRVENIVKIKAQDEKEFQAVAGLVDSWSEVRYESVEFEHSDKDGLKKNALTLAIDKVTEKKRMYEEKLGVNLTPKGFSEGAVVAVPASARPGYLRNTSVAYDGGLLTGGLRDVKSAEPAAVEEVPTSFGELVFVGRVNVEYAVEPR